MKVIKYVAILIASLLVLSILFYGITFPAKNFIGCYIDSYNANKLCINSDNTFDQMAYENGSWRLFNRTTWSSVKMEDVSGEFVIVTVESTMVDKNKILKNITLQPYMDVFGRVKISIGIDSEKYKAEEIYRKL